MTIANKCLVLTSVCKSVYTALEINKFKIDTYKLHDDKLIGIQT